MVVGVDVEIGEYDAEAVRVCRDISGGKRNWSRAKGWAGVRQTRRRQGQAQGVTAGHSSWVAVGLRRWQAEVVGGWHFRQVT